MDNENELPEERPPFFKTWKSVYFFVMSVFGLLVVLFYLFSKAYN